MNRQGFHVPGEVGLNGSTATGFTAYYEYAMASYVLADPD
jgi:hypothetical protein